MSTIQRDKALNLLSHRNRYQATHSQHIFTESKPMTEVTVENNGTGRQRVTLQKQDCPQIVGISIRSRAEPAFMPLAIVSDGTGRRHDYGSFEFEP